METCINEPRADARGCCFYFNGECGGHGVRGDGRPMPFTCVLDLLDKERKRKRAREEKEKRSGLLKWAR